MAKSLAWYTAKSAVGKDLTACHYNYVKSKSLLTASTNVRAHERSMLSNLGYTQPDLNAAWRAFYVAKTGLSANTDIDALESAFFGNNTLDYI